MKGLLVLFAALIPRVKDLDNTLGEAFQELGIRMTNQYDELVDALERGNKEVVFLHTQQSNYFKECEHLRNRVLELEQAGKKEPTEYNPVITIKDVEVLEDVIHDAQTYYEQPCFYDHVSPEFLQKMRMKSFEALNIVSRLSNGLK